MDDILGLHMRLEACVLLPEKGISLIILVIQVVLITGSTYARIHFGN